DFYWACHLRGGRCTTISATVPLSLRGARRRSDLDVPGPHGTRLLRFARNDIGNGLLIGGSPRLISWPMSRSSQITQPEAPRPLPNPPPQAGEGRMGAALVLFSGGQDSTTCLA